MANSVNVIQYQVNMPATGAVNAYQVDTAYVKVKKVKGSGFYIASLTPAHSDQHRFTMWQTTGINDGGVRRQRLPG